MSEHVLVNLDDVIGTAVAFLGMLLLAAALGVELVYREPTGALVLAVPGLLLAVQASLTRDEPAPRPDGSKGPAD